MDSQKLLKIVGDILQEEATFNFQTRLENVSKFFTANDGPSLNTELGELSNELKQSTTSFYVESELKLLKELNMEDVFGQAIILQINEILDSQAHEVASKLENFISKRREALTKLENIKSALTSVGIKPRLLKDSNFELGFMLPQEYLELDKLEDVLKDLKLFLVNLADSTEEDKTFKINSVSNGCIEIFISASPQIAKHFLTVLDYISKIYEAIKLYQLAKKGYENFSERRKKSMEKINDAELKDGIEKNISELIKKLPVKSTEKTRMERLFKDFLQHFQKGLSAEVRTPTISEPKEKADASPEEKKKFKEDKIAYELKRSIDDKNREIYLLQTDHSFRDKTLLLAPVLTEEATAPDNA